VTDFGLTPTGFVPKTEDDVLADLETALRGKFGQSINLTPQARFGQLAGIFAERFGQLWALGEALYAAFDPDQATGAALDAIAAITGTIRLAATRSQVTLTLTGTIGSPPLAGRIVSVQSTGVKFKTKVDSPVFVAAPAWQSGHVYGTLGVFVTNANRIYVLITAGTSAGSGGPTTTAADITDNTAHWRYVGEGTAYAQVAAESVDTGPKVAASGTLTVIETPVARWESAINLLDAVNGRDVESDSALRLRREAEIHAQGNAVAEAIRADVLRVTDVTSVTVFANDTDVTDADGVPPHSVEVMVQGGVDQDIRAAIFATKAAGIGTTGNVTGTVTDSQGVAHTIKFSRPTLKTVYVDITVLYDATLYPSDGDDEIKAAIVAYGAVQKTGKDVVASSIGAQAFAVAGVLDANPVKISLTAGPTVSTTIPIGSRELAVYDTSRIVVHSSAATP
jgi:uncharacterized phage protein gp47/JayE